MSYIKRKLGRANAEELPPVAPTHEDLLSLPVNLSAHKSPLRSDSPPSEPDSPAPEPDKPPVGPLEKLLGEWGALLTHPSAVSLIEGIFCQPAYLAFFGILTTYILGYFHFNYIFALLFSLFINFAASRVIQRVKSNAVHKDRKYSANIRKEMYPDKESALWVNNIITAVITNHHTYISAILLRFLNPVLKRLFAISPINSLEFTHMDIGNIPPTISNCAVKTDDKEPAKNVKFDFDVDLTTTLQGSMRMSLSFLPDIPIEVSNLCFRCRMRLEVTFLENVFPFVSPFRVSILEQPAIDISVRVAGFPDFLILPFVTDHYMKVFRRFLYQEIGAPSCVEIDLNTLLANIGEDSLAEAMGSAIPSVVSHGKLNDDKGSRIGKRKALQNFAKTLTPKRSSRKMHFTPDIDPALDRSSPLAQSTGSRVRKRDSLRSSSVVKGLFRASMIRGTSSPNAPTAQVAQESKKEHLDIGDSANSVLHSSSPLPNPANRSTRKSKLAQEYREKDLRVPPTHSRSTPQGKRWRQSQSCDESSLQQIIDANPIRQTWSTEDDSELDEELCANLEQSATLSWDDE